MRHSSIHGEEADELREQLAKQSTRTSRACQACAKSKQRCKGSVPCQRCLSRNIQCRFDQVIGKRKFIKYARDSDIERDKSASVEASEVTRSSALVPGSTLQLDPQLSTNPDKLLACETPVSGTSGNTSLTVTHGPTTVSHAAPTVSSNHEQASFPVLGNLDPVSHLQWNDQMDLSAYPFFWTDLERQSFFRDDFFNHHWDNIAGNDPAQTDADRTQSFLPMNQADTNMSSSITTGTYTPANVHFPFLSQSDLDILQGENVCHTHHISLGAFDTIKKMFYRDQKDKTVVFPTAEMFHVFTNLYFEHFDPLFPCIHVSQVEKEDASWILLLAIAGAGASCSTIAAAEIYATSLQALLEQAVRENVSRTLECQIASFTDSVDPTVP